MHLNDYFKVVAFGILADFCLNTDVHILSKQRSHDAHRKGRDFAS